MSQNSPVAFPLIGTPTPDPSVGGGPGQQSQVIYLGSTPTEGGGPAQATSVFFAAAVPIAQGGPAQASSALFSAAVPTMQGGPAQSSQVEFFPTLTAGPAVDGLVLSLDSVPVDVFRLLAGTVNLKIFRENLDIALLGRIRKSVSGRASLWNDDSVVVITIGGGANQGTISMGRAGPAGGVRLNTGPTFENGELTSELALELEAAGPAADLSLRSLGQTFPINEVGDVSLSPDYVAVSVIGVLNEQETLPRPSVGSLWANNTGGPIPAGSAVRIVGNLEVDLASAGADDGASRFIGVMERVTADTAEGRVISEGRVSALFAAGEGAGNLATSRVYLSVTSGLLTLVPPAAVGNVVLDVGVVISSAGYVDGSGGNMLVLLQRGLRRVVA